jgi:hypothetical protein
MYDVIKEHKVREDIAKAAAYAVWNSSKIFETVLRLEEWQSQ